MVEDDDQVLEVIPRFLSQAGYTVLAAANQETALYLLGRDGPTVELIVTDLVRPGMNGLEFAAAAARVHPGAKVLFMAGFPGDEPLKRDALAAGHSSIDKPFSPEALLQAVRESLGA